MVPETLAEAALYWASRGFFVLPLRPKSKKPLAGSHGAHDASNDIEVIKKWWADHPDANIGVAPDRAGHMILDIDPPAGENSIFDLELAHGFLPDTLTIRTPRGGRQVYLQGKGGVSVSKLGPNLDTRGYGSYGLLPPSYVVDTEKGINGGYAVERIAEIAPDPWIARELRQQRIKNTGENVELNLPVNVDRAREFLHQQAEQDNVAIQGAGGDHFTFRMACTVLDMGVSEAKALELMSSEWNAACDPPWEPEDLKRKIENAALYKQNSETAWAVKPLQDTFAHIAAGLSDEERIRKPSRFRVYSELERAEFREPEWIIPDFIAERSLVQFTGKEKSFKSFLALDVALGLASGTETFGYAPQPRPVVYVAGENAHSTMLKHIPAWRLSRLLEKEIPFYIVKAIPRAQVGEETAELLEQIKLKSIQPALVILDTATRALRGLDENSAKDMGLFSAMCEHIQNELNCTVLTIRHMGKDNSRGGRGSNVIDGDFDTIIDIERHEKTLLVQAKVREQRNAQEREEPYCFEGSLVGPSLVFNPLSSSAYRKATAPKDSLTNSEVGAVLVRLGQPVTRYVLAQELTGHVQGETQETWEKAVRRTERELKARARSQLACYCDDAGQIWSIPTA